MNTAVILKKWNGQEYESIDCKTVSQAIAILGEDPETMLFIVDTDSTGEIHINGTPSPEVTSYIP